MLVRLLTPGPSAARGALDGTLDRAHQRAHLRPADPDRVWHWLVALALERIGLRADADAIRSLLAGATIHRAPNVAALRDQLNAHGPTVSPFTEGPTDATLLVLVRALPLPARQVLALSTLYGLPDAAISAMLGVSDRELAGLRETALQSIYLTLQQYGQRQLRGAALAPKPLPRLVPLPASVDGIAVIHGTRVYVDRNVPNGLVGALLKLLERLQERLRQTLHLRDPTDDDVGDSRSHRPLDPTPTAQPMRKPRLTPSLEPHRLPKATGGTGVHRRSPQSTPSTQRLSSPSRPVSNRSGTYAWLKR
jgi:hypothetical protein